MSEEIDINSIISDFVENRYKDLIAGLQTVLATATNAARLRLKSTYKGYLKTLWDRHSKTKSFFIRGEPSYLYDFYVPLGLKLGNKVTQHPEITDFAAKFPCTVLTASAGSGKSIFMRHLLMSSIIKKWKIPIFLELRDFNHRDSDILQAILDGFIEDKLDFDSSMLHGALKAGHFVVLLDGFDEVGTEKREAVLKAILALQKRFPETPIVVSSRPDNSLHGWPNFVTTRLEPLGIVQAIELIKKLPFEPEAKDKFIEELERTLFMRHKSFASNPLLLSIMLLTYAQSLSIPDKLSVFYNQAYEALFERHDALKGGYKRKRRTDLDIQEFGKVFAAFCLQAYDKRQFHFSASECLSYIEKASKISQIPCDKVDYLADAKESVGLLVDDGLLIAYPHRSFQEFFTSRFISEAAPDVQQRLVEKYCRSLFPDNVMKLLYEMRPDVVEKYFLKPALDTLFTKLGVKKKVRITHYLRYLKMTYEVFTVDAEDGVRGEVAHKGKFYYTDVIRFCMQECARLYDWKGFPGGKPDAWFVEKYGSIEGGARFDVKKRKTNSSFVKDLSSCGEFFSLGMLDYALAIRDAINEKHKEVDATLEEILS